MPQDDRGIGSLEHRRPPLKSLVAGAEDRLRIPEPRKHGRSRTKPRSFSTFCLVVVYSVSGIVLFLTMNGSVWQTDTFDQNQRNAGGICDGYNGVLHISQGDVEGAAGTIFFLFVVNQLIYADKHNLMPWVHLNNVSHYVYDPTVHERGPSITAQMRFGANASWTGFVDPISQQQVAFPGRPLAIQSPLTEQQTTVTGNGVCNSYFLPVSSFSPGAMDVSCQRLPLVRLTHAQIIPALHIHCPWAVRAWRYGGLPPSLRQEKLSYEEWFAPMRKRGNEIVRKYVRFRPHLQKLANTANPSQECLALHIRHSDKANRRRRIPVQNFLPYVQAYTDEQRLRDNASIFLATDSQMVIQEIERSWPKDVVKRMKWQERVVRSNDTTPVFTLSSSHHLTNTQVLVDILAMSKCQFLLHGLSAVSEAVHYLNQDLHHKNRSVNLDISKHLSEDQFRQVIRKNGAHQFSKG